MRRNYLVLEKVGTQVPSDECSRGTYDSITLPWHDPKNFTAEAVINGEFNKYSNHYEKIPHQLPIQVATRYLARGIS